MSQDLALALKPPILKERVECTPVRFVVETSQLATPLYFPFPRRGEN